ncbi:hypothetical protein N0V95_007190, partial [Ascochyta clinopodiicola]
LQYLSLLIIDADIQNLLGRLPPGLYDLYGKMYDNLSTAPGELKAMVFKNVLYWLLCAQRTLHTEEFLAVVSIDPRKETATSSISKDLVLEICNNFVIFDSELDTFRFAHLSVREFLEKRPGFDASTSNRLISEVCLWSVLSTDSDSTTEDLLCQAGLQVKSVSTQSELLSVYADIYWAVHCKSAGKDRDSGLLDLLLRYILNTTSSLARWRLRLETHLRSPIHWRTESQLNDTMTNTEAASASGLLVCCVLDFKEQIDAILEGELPGTLYINSGGQTHLQVAASNGCCATLERLITRHWPDAQIPVEVVVTAAGSYYNAKEVMALLLDRRGADVVITKEVVKAAASNYNNAEEVMALLLNRRGNEMHISSEVVEMMALGFDSEVMALLLHKRGKEVHITSDVVEAAAKNPFSGKEVMALLLDRRDCLSMSQQTAMLIASNLVYIVSLKNDRDDLKTWLDQGGDPNFVSDDGSTPLTAAASLGQLEVVSLLLEYGADISKTNQDNWAPLSVAAIRGHIEVVRLLLEKRANVNAENEDYGNVLGAAAYGGHKALMELLLENGANIDTEGFSFANPLAAAAAGGSKETVELLLSNGASIHAECGGCGNVLNAAAHGGNTAIVTMLLDKGADAHVSGDLYANSLGAAAFGGNIDIVKVLLDRGIDIHKQGGKYGNALGAAAAGGKKDIVELLLRLDVDVNADGRQHRGTIETASFDSVSLVTGLLRQERGSVSVTKNDGRTPLVSASSGGHLEVVKLLLDKGADVSIANNDGWTSLSSACSSGHVEVAQLLLDKGADPLTATTSGLTPLDSAIFNRHVNIVRLLLKNEVYSAVDGRDSMFGTIANTLSHEGYTDLLRSIVEHNNANLHLADSHNRTPLLVAAKGGHTQTVKYLVAQGMAVKTEDAKGDGLISYAASSGSLDVVHEILALEPELISPQGHWSPLHWACRAGNAEIVETLIAKGFESGSVKVTDMQGEWSPLAVAILHGNKSMIADLSGPSQAVLGVRDVDACVEGGWQNGAWCNGCFHVGRLLSRF